MSAESRHAARKLAYTRGSRRVRFGLFLWWLTRKTGIDRHIAEAQTAMLNSLPDAKRLGQ